jgi:hypothetical protein
MTYKHPAAQSKQTNNQIPKSQNTLSKTGILAILATSNHIGYQTRVHLHRKTSQNATFFSLSQGFSNFFVSRPISRYFQISATLECCKLQ